MANVFVDDSYLTATANAIRAKNNSTDTYKPSEFANAIASISDADTPFEAVADVITEESVSVISATLKKPCRYVSISFVIPTESVGSSRNVYFGTNAITTDCFHRSSTVSTSETNYAIYNATAEIIGGAIISYGGIAASASVDIDYTSRPVYGVLRGYGAYAEKEMLKADSFTTIYIYTYGSAFPVGSKLKIYGY